MADRKLSTSTPIVTPADNDLAMIVDVSDVTDGSGGTNKLITWANIKATLLTYFNTVYSVLGHGHTESDISDLVHTTARTDEEIEDLAGGMFTGNTESGITATYQDADGTVDLTVASQTENDFTTTLKNKLDAIEASATADQTAAQIKTAYESNAETNAVTDAEKTVLGNTSGSNSGDQTIPTVDDTAYNATSWNTNADAASKNAIRDKVETMLASIALNTAKVTYPSADSTKVGFITITQAVDLDQLELDVAALDQSVVLQGTWDASVGTFPGSGSAQSGASWIVSVGGTIDSQVFVANDRIVATTDNASTSVYSGNWHKLDYTDEVLSVAGKTGAVTLVAADTTDFDTEVSNNTSVAANTTHKNTTSGNPHSVSASDVSLGNVDNTSNATERAATATLAGKTLTTPTIASLTNAQHDHSNAAGGGTIAAAETSWSEVSTFANSWVNYDGGTTYNTAAYKIDLDGFVHLKGLIKSGTLNASTGAFTLPVGYRPGKSTLHVVAANNSGVLRVLSDGVVRPVSGSNVWFSLEGVTFKA